MNRDEMVKALKEIAWGYPEGYGKRVIAEKLIAALESEGVLAEGWAREGHLEEFRAGESGTLLLGKVHHYDDDIRVRILAAKEE